MSKDANTELLRCLQELHLPTMRAQHEAVARQATEQSWGYAAYLLELVQRECQQRRHNRIERLLKASRLPLEKSWSALDLKRLPTKVVQQLRGLLSGDFVDQRQNILMFGPPGAGKTHALCAVAQELVRAGRRVLHTKCSLLVQDLLAAKRRSGSEGIAEAAGDLGGLGDRRPGLCGTEPGGNGGVIHAAGVAPVAVAALRLPTPRQPPTPQSFPGAEWGKVIVAGGER